MVDSEKNKTSLDEVLGSLEDVGRVDSEGQFTLAREKARQKMRKFTLADARSYVLELVQAASLKGASKVEFRIGPLNMKMEFDGEAFTSSDFNRIYDSLFSNRSDRPTRALRQLALGINSAMALEPKRVEVESGDGRTGAWLHLGADGKDEHGPLEDDVPTGTRIQVRDRFGGRTFGAFFKNIAGRLPEEVYLKEHCRYARIDLVWEGKSLQYDEPPVLIGKAEIGDLAGREDGFEGWAGFRENSMSAREATLVINDVTISTVELERLDAQMAAVVHGPALRKDASQRKVVRNSAFQRMEGAVYAASQRAIANLVELWKAGEAPDWAVGYLREKLKERARKSLLGGSEPSGVRQALRSMPFWETTDGEPLTWDALKRQVDGRGLLYSRKRFGGMRLEDERPILWLHREEDLGLLNHAFSHRKLRNAAHHLAKERKRRARYREFRARVAAPVLPDGLYAGRIQVEAPGVRGEMGIAPGDGMATMSWIVDGALLEETRFDCGIPGLRLALEAKFEPDSRYENARRTRRAGELVAAAAVQLPELLEKIGDNLQKEHISLEFIREVVLDVLILTGKRGGKPWRQINAGLGLPASRRRMRGINGWNQPWDPVDSSIGALKVLQTAEGPVALADLEQRDVVEYVDEDHALAEGDVLLVDSELRGALTSLLGTRFKDAVPRLQKLKREREFLAQEPQRPITGAPGDALSEHIESGSLQGRIDLVPGASGSGTITVMLKGRPLTEMAVNLPGRWGGWIDSEDLTPTEDYRDVQHDESWRALQSRFDKAAANLVLQVAERVQSGDGEGAAFVREMLAFIFPVPAMRKVWENLWPRYGAQASDFWMEILGGGLMEDSWASLGHQLRGVSTGRKVKLSQQRGFQRENRDLFDLLWPETSAPPHERVLQPATPLDDVPVLRWVDNRKATLADIRRALDDGRVYVVSTRDRVQTEEKILVAETSDERAFLDRLLGSRAIPGAELLEDVLNRHRFELKKQRERIEINGMVAVRVSLDNGREGEVGLRAHSGARIKPSALVTVFVSKRQLEVVSYPCPARLTAAVNDDRLTANESFDSVLRDEAWKKLCTELLSYWGRLVGELLDATIGRGYSGSQGVWYHALDYLHATGKGRGGSSSRKSDSSRGSVTERLRQLSRLQTTAGRRVSLDDLARENPPRAISGQSWQRVPHELRRAVRQRVGGELVILDEYEAWRLPSLVPRLKLLDEQIAKHVRELQIIQSAPEFEEPTPEALVSVRPPNVDGLLWLDPSGQTGVMAVVDGKQIGKIQASPCFQCAGWVRGAGVSAGNRLGEVVLTSKVHDGLQRAAANLYRELLRLWQARSLPGRGERRVVSKALGDATVWLAVEQKQGGVSHEGEWKQFLDDAVDEPVIRLAQGQMVSLQTILRERPREFSGMGLWEGSTVERRGQGSTRARPSGAPHSKGSRRGGKRTPDKERPPRRRKRKRGRRPGKRGSRENDDRRARHSKGTSPEEGLLENVRWHLRLGRGEGARLLADVQLDRLALGGGSGETMVTLADEHVVLDVNHPVVRLAAKYTEDLVLRAFVASAVFTGLNQLLVDVTNVDEASFHSRMASMDL